MSDFDLKYDIIAELLKDFLESSDNRIKMTINDAYSSASRAMSDRRKAAAAQLIRDFREFVIIKNEWP